MGDVMSVVVNVAVVSAGVLVALVVAYQLTLAIAACFYRGPSRRALKLRPLPRVVLLVPAHNEASTIASCVHSLRRQSYERALYQIVVVSDNCVDDTALRAQRAGATVMVRRRPSEAGKGHALKWAFERVLRNWEPDAVVVVDADARADEDFLAKLVWSYVLGADVVQGESLIAETNSRRGMLRVAAFLLVNHVRPAGRAVLGLPSNLAGNGTLFARRVLESVPWDAFTGAEDVEYSVKLRQAGVAPVFGGGAILRSPGPPSDAAAETQRLRWEGGKVHVARTQLPSLVRRGLKERKPLLLDAAVELAIPPLSLLTAVIGVGATASVLLSVLGVMPLWALVPWALAVVGLPSYVLLGLRVAHASPSVYRSLVAAPLLALRKAATSYRLLRFRSTDWVRTQRAGEGDASPLGQ
jgi:cellulose synthase/poly-beta-1,6-N-acetylglucosamine synthase-like glycosyltransferase